jgi:hypothetical protein
MVPFAVFWQRLKEDFAKAPLVEGRDHARTIRHWSAKRGPLDGRFLAVWSDDTVVCHTEEGSQHPVGRAEFEKIYRVWPDYIAGAKGRSYLAHDLGVQNSAYIIGVLHAHQDLMIP